MSLMPRTPISSACALVCTLALLLSAGAPSCAVAAAGSGREILASGAETLAFGALLSALASVADGDTDRGAARLDDLAVEAKDKGDASSEGFADWGLAVARLRQGRFAEARDLAARSRAAFEAAGEPSRARSTEELGSVASDRLDGRPGDTGPSEAAFLGEVGLLEAHQLHLGDALRHFDAGIARIQGSGHPAEEAALHAYRGMILAVLQRFGPAEADMEQFSKLATAAAPQLEPLISLTRELVLGAASWKFDRVIDQLQRIGEIYHDRLPAWYFDNLDLANLLQQGHARPAAKACHKMLADRAAAQGSLSDTDTTMLEMACAAVDAAAAPDDGEVPTEQLQALAAAVMKAVAIQPEPFRAPLELLAKQFQSLAANPDAKRQWLANADLLKAIGGLQGIVAGAAPPQLRSPLDSLLTPLIGLFTDLEGDGNDPAKSYALAEEARSRDLLDRLVDARLAEGGDGPQTSRISKLRAQRDALNRAIRDRQLHDPTTADLADLETQLSRVRNEIDREFERLALSVPSADRQQPVPLESVQGALGHDTTLVAYFTFPSNLDDTLAWVADRDRLKQVILPIRYEDLQAKVKRLVRSLRDRSDVRAQAEDLYRVLWRPLRSRIHTRRVLVVPHGPLQELPFAALRDPDSGRWLIQEATLLYAPSASAWFRLRTRGAASGRPPLILGSPGGDLPAAAKEARSVAALWGVEPLLGSRASEVAFRARAPGALLVHVASHGVLDSEDPMFSRLDLAPSEGGATDPRRDGRLELHEVVDELDLSGTRLVVLPACHTGQGPRTRGDEVTSLARAFLLAGARATVTAAWAIDDAASASLMVDFHRRLAAGTEVAEALRGAQEAAIASAGRSHPWYWAGFALHGAGGVLPSPSRPRASQPSWTDGVEGSERPRKEPDPWR